MKYLKTISFLTFIFFIISGVAVAGLDQDNLPIYKAQVERAPHQWSVTGYKPEIAAMWALSASSYFKSKDGGNFLAENLMDGDTKTGWAEGAEGDGVDQWIELSYLGIPGNKNARIIISGFYFSNGWGKSPRHWEACNRVRRFRLEHNGRPLCRIDLSDTPLIQMVKTGVLKIKPGDRLRLVIESVYQGTLYRDTCVSEILPRLIR